MSFKLIIAIIFVSLLMAGGLLGYRLFLTDPAASNSAAAINAGDSGLAAQGLNSSLTPAEAERSDFTRLLARFNAIGDLKTGVLSSPAFRSLYDFIFPIPTPAPGRNNPFAPAGL